MSSGSHLSKELFDLVKSIGDSRSKQEEDKIITQEATQLKTKISEPSIPPKKMKEMLIRAIYIEMLGHDASFAYIHAINQTNCSSIVSKRVGYVACAACLPAESPMLILLVANLQRDLQSPNYLEISSALTAVCKLVNTGFLHAFSEQILKLTTHSHELVRKKAVIVLSRFIKLNPSLSSDYAAIFRKNLCDKDPSVMGASLNSFAQILQDSNSVPLYKDLISSFVVILRQIADHRLPRDFDYHRIPAPWLQIRMLEILSILGEDDKRASDQMYDIISEVMRRADEIGANIGYAIVYQCLKTITKIYPNPSLIENAAQLVSRFLTADNNNLKYTGITGLISIVKINPSYSLRHQLVVVDCLEDTDETLKRKTLTLLYKMTNNSNVKIIIEKLNNELKSAAYDHHLRQEIVFKITELTEKFAPDSKWYLKTMNEMFEVASDFIKPEIVNNLVKLIDEWRDDASVIQFTLNEYFNLLYRIEFLPDCLMQVTAWVLGEFGDMLSNDLLDTTVDLLCKSLFKRFEDSLTKGWILSALQKLNKGVPSEQCKDFISRFSTSRNEDLQQRCYEFAGTSTKLSEPLEFKNNLKLDFSFEFLDGFVQQQIIKGAKTYNQDKNRKGLNYLIHKSRNEDYKASEALQSMRLEPYQAPNLDKFTSRPVEIRQNASELQVKAKVWSKQGYIGSNPESENTRSASSSSVQTYAPKSQFIKSEKEIAKETFVNGLFGGIGGRENPKLQPSSTPKPAPVKKQPENLLDI
jgi:AP-4 complex subunit epsilon-1